MEWSFVIGSGVLATLMAYQISVAYEEPFPKLEQRAVYTQDQRMDPLQAWGTALQREPEGEMIQIIEQAHERIQTSDPVCENESLGISADSQNQAPHPEISRHGVTDADKRLVGEHKKTV